MKLRRKTYIDSTHYQWRKFEGFTIGLGIAKTDNGVGFITMTVKSKKEPKDNRSLASDVMYGRFKKALAQYRKGAGKVDVKLTTLIPADSMP